MSTLRSRFALTVSVLHSLFAVACSNSVFVAIPPPLPPSTGPFSNASLKGQYAFSMAGSELCGGFSSFFARVGTFTADGNGNITGGLEDVNLCTGVESLQFTGGTYTISPNGRGNVRLTNSSGTSNYRVTISSATQGFILQTDASATASGSFQRQNTAAFSNPAIQGGYVFDFNGVDVVAGISNSASIIGRFDASGGGGISSGVFDSNIGGTLSGQQPFPAGAFYQIDPNSDGATFGRATANIAGHNFVFYVVDATHMKFLGTDFPSALVGDAIAQQNISFNIASLSGSFAFLIGGSSSNGPIATAGRFTANGAGNITNVVLDENNSGAITLLPNGTVTGSYTVDANQLGGGTLTWTDTNAGTFSFIFYLVSPSQAVLQETDSSIVSDGTFSAQTTIPISAAGLAGNFAFVWSGVSSAEEDFVGQLALTAASTNNFTGIMDFNEFGTGQLFFNVPINGSLTLNGDGTQANAYTVNSQTTPANTFNFTAYIIDQTTVLLVGVDNNRVIAGTLARQP